MVREEAQEEDGFGGGGGAAALFGGGSGGPLPGEGGGCSGDGGGGGPLHAAGAASSGLLSRALRPLPVPGRSVSLHNLLAVSPGRDGGGGDGSGGGGGGGAGGCALPPGGGGPPHSPTAAASTAPPPPPPAFATPGGSSEDEDGEGGEEGGGSDASASGDGDGAAPAHRQPTHTRPPRGGRRPPWGGKAGVLDALNELIDDLGEMDGNIALRAGDHVHANEVVLTLGACRTVQRFLIEASKKRDFQVVVAEGACPASGHAAAAALARAGVSTTLIADSAIFAVASRANKVLLGAAALLANGGVLAPSGAHLLALAAARHAAPLVVLVGMHQLSPLFPHDPALALNDFGSPADVLPYAYVAAPGVSGAGWAGDSLGGCGGGFSPLRRGGGSGPFNPAAGGGVGGGGAAHPAPGGPAPPLHVHAPRRDYVPPELIALFVTDTGGYTPSYVYRLLAEYYSRADFSLGER
jgi:translation initiation factor 2B subunit (eIF-2B alpha/beta/delta family)